MFINYRKKKKGSVMKRKVWLGILVASLFGASTVFAQLSDFQKQMMEQMQKKMMGGGGAGDATTGTQQPTIPVSTTPMVVTQGKAVFNDSSLGTNGKSCGSCHVEGKKPLDGREVDNRLVAFVQYCYEHAIGGQKVIDTDKLDKIIAYFDSFGSKSDASMFQGSAPAQGGQMPMQQQSPMMQQGVEEDAW